MDDSSISKQTAGKKAVDFIKAGMIVGLGTGSTFQYALEEIGNRLKKGALINISCLASSVKTEQRARQLGIPLTSFKHFQEIDLTIDGADEVSNHLDLIKGGGGALMREKILAQNSHRFIVIVDETKVSTFLGEKWTVPVEVLPFAWEVEAHYLKSIGVNSQIRLNKDNEMYCTDQGNYILDCQFGVIKEPEEIAALLDRRAGILAHGLFIKLATDVIIASGDQIRHVTANRQQ